MKTLLILLSLTAYGQVTINAPAVTLNANGTTAIIAWMSTQLDNGKGNLASDIDDVQTTITLNNTTGLGGAAMALIIDGEHMQVTARNGAVYTVTRGVNGTTATAHSVDANVRELKFKTLNAVGKQMILDAMRSIVRQHRQAAISAAVVTVEAESIAAVQ